MARWCPIKHSLKIFDVGADFQKSDLCVTISLLRETGRDEICQRAQHSWKRE